jgi:hypothetical protein
MSCIAPVVRPVSHVVMMKLDGCHDTLEVGDEVVPIFDSFPSLHGIGIGCRTGRSLGVSPFMPSVDRTEVYLNLNHQPQLSNYHNKSRLAVSPQLSDMTSSSEPPTQGRWHTVPPMQQHSGLVSTLQQSLSPDHNRSTAPHQGSMSFVSAKTIAFSGWNTSRLWPICIP